MPGIGALFSHNVEAVRVCWGAMPGRLDKSCIGIMCDFVAVDPEGCGVDEALWLFVGKAIAADRISHQEFAGRNQRHAIRKTGTHGQ